MKPLQGGDDGLRPLRMHVDCTIRARRPRPVRIRDQQRLAHRPGFHEVAAEALQPRQVAHGVAAPDQRAGMLRLDRAHVDEVALQAVPGDLRHQLPSLRGIGRQGQDEAETGIGAGMQGQGNIDETADPLVGMRPRQIEREEAVRRQFREGARRHRFQHQPAGRHAHHEHALGRKGEQLDRPPRNGLGLEDPVVGTGDAPSPVPVDHRLLQAGEPLVVAPEIELGIEQVGIGAADHIDQAALAEHRRRPEQREAHLLAVALAGNAPFRAQPVHRAVGNTFERNLPFGQSRLDGLQAPRVHLAVTAKRGRQQKTARILQATSGLQRNEIDQ